MKCTECGNAMTRTVGDHVYRESGLENVMLLNITKYDCESCGAKRVNIPAMGQLHRLLAHMISTKPARLESTEVRFIRDHLGLSNKDFAALMGVSEHQASRWTSSEPIGVPAERFLRMLATMGPITLAAGAPTVAIGKAEEFVADVRSTLANLPSKDEPVREVAIRVRRNSNDWKSSPAMSAT
jgi:putative transcriptional regulator